MKEYSDLEAAIFDLGGVVFGISLKPVIKSWAESAGVHPQKIAEKFKADSHYERFETGEISPDEYRAYVCSVQGIQLSDEDFERGWNDIYLDVIPGVESILEELQKHLKLVVLTNTNQIHAPEWRKRYRDILTYFEKIFASHEIGARKPDAEAFQIVLDYLNIKPDKVVFIDDRIENVRGAESVGLRGILTPTTAQVVEKLQPLVSVFED